MVPYRMTRRDFLKAASLGAGALFTPAWAASPSTAFTPDAEISITATDRLMPILAGAQTRVYHYEGKLLGGSGVTVGPVPGSYLGPILRVRSGTKLRIYFHNNLIEKSVIHPHGLRVPENCDGTPMQAIAPKETKIYEFQAIDHAMPAWFHPHPMNRTSEQVMMGLAGLFYIWDDDEEKAVPGASTGANDVPVVIQDRSFDSRNQLLYQPNMMFGFLGSRILVNGKPDAVLSLEPRAYRLRLLNGSNARTYKLAWSNGMPLTVIGTDGGLLPAAVTRSYLMLMPAERADVWVDFSSLAGGSVTLRSQEFTAGGMGMMGGMGGGMGRMGGGSSGMGMMGGSGMMGGMGMMGGSGLPMGAAFDILTVNVGRDTTAKPVLGALPPLSTRFDASNVSNFSSPRPFVVSMAHMAWTINGRVYEEMAVAEDEKVKINQPMAWEWINTSPIPHPMHIHNIQYQVVGRSPDYTPAGYATVNQGFVDSGWKDTVMVYPGERVKIAMQFGPHTGMYMYHCHILEHEDDMGMMRNLLVMDGSKPGMPGMPGG